MNDADLEEGWLPTSDQMLMAHERAILAALDTNLLLAARALRAEHAAQLEEDESSTLHHEPRSPQLALTQSILILAASLRELIASYRTVTGRLLRDDRPSNTP